MRETDFLTELNTLRNQVESQQETLTGFNTRLENFQSELNSLKETLTFSRVLGVIAALLNFVSFGIFTH